MIQRRQRTQVHPELSGDRVAVTIIGIARDVGMPGLSRGHVHDEEGPLQPFPVKFQEMRRRHGQAAARERAVDLVFKVALGLHQSGGRLPAQDHGPVDCLAALVPAGAKAKHLLAAAAGDAGEIRD